MPQCGYCQKSLGFFKDKVSKNVDNKIIYLCPTCVDNWTYYHKKQVVTELCKQGVPKALFIVPNASCKDPDDYFKTLLGPILFTDKAVCFFEFGSTSGSTAGWQFGFIGGGIAALFDNKAMNAQILSAQAGEMKDGPIFEELAKASKALIVIPRETITDIRLQGGGWEMADPAIEIKAGKGKNHYFNLLGKPKELRERFELEIKKYLQRES